MVMRLGTTYLVRYRLRLCYSRILLDGQPAKVLTAKRQARGVHVLLLPVVAERAGFEPA
jgi:hypothetical protein